MGAKAAKAWCLEPGASIYDRMRESVMIQITMGWKFDLFLDQLSNAELKKKKKKPYKPDYGSSPRRHTNI